MKIGPYEIFTVQTGYVSLDGGAMFGVVPKILWNKTNPADELNRIQLALRTLVINGNDRLILIDAGVGSKMNEKLQKIYKVDHQEHELEQGLAEKGITFDQVTDVIITHLHFDHVGGATIEENGVLKPTFPNAKYYVQGEQWYWANHPSEKTGPVTCQKTLNPLKKPGNWWNWMAPRSFSRVLKCWSCTAIHTACSCLKFRMGKARCFIAPI